MFTIFRNTKGWLIDGSMARSCKCSVSVHRVSLCSTMDNTKYYSRIGVALEILKIWRNWPPRLSQDFMTRIEFVEDSFFFSFFFLFGGIKSFSQLVQVRATTRYDGTVDAHFQHNCRSFAPPPGVSNS